MPTDKPSADRGVPAKCATCSGPMQSPVFCDHCRSLYPADGLNHYALLGQPATYDVDTQALRREYLHASRHIHPDQHGQRGDALSLRLSAQLNEAYRVLTDPVLRAEYLLELVGGPSAAEDKNVGPDVLGQTLELRSQIQEAKAAANADALAAAGRAARAAYDESLAEIASLARRLPADETVRRTLRAALNAMKYYQRILTEL